MATPSAMHDIPRGREHARPKSLQNQTLPLFHGSGCHLPRPELRLIVTVDIKLIRQCLDVGGWVPRGRLAEDGVIPSRYAGLRETASADPAERTRLNVQECDGSLIVSHGLLRGGSLLAAGSAEELGRPLLHIDLLRRDMADAVTAAAGWVRTQRIHALGVGGPRAREDPRVYDATVVLLSGLLGWLLAADAAAATKM
jgi:hypothetical protein